MAKRREEQGPNGAGQTTGDGHPRTGALMQGTLWILVLLVLTSIGLSAWGAATVPATAEVPIQWNARGATTTVGKTAGLILLPAIQAGLIALAWVIPLIAPRQGHLAQSRKAYRTTWLTVIALLTLAHGLSMVNAAGLPVPVERIILSAVALMLVIVGNVLSKVRSNFFLGVRTPWTLSSEHVWRRTHRFAGRSFVAVGIVSFVLGLFAALTVLGAVLVAGALLAAAGSILYSYLVWRRAPDLSARVGAARDQAPPGGEDDDTQATTRETSEGT